MDGIARSLERVAVELGEHSALGEVERADRDGVVRGTLDIGSAARLAAASDDADTHGQDRAQRKRPTPSHVPPRGVPEACPTYSFAHLRPGSVGNLLRSSPRRADAAAMLNLEQAQSPSSPCCSG